MKSPAKKYFIPLGEDCQLGAALNFYGYKESSLLKWAKISTVKLLNAVNDNFEKIYDARYADVFFRPTKGRAGIIGDKGDIVLPRKGGWGSYDEYMAILDMFDPEQLFNTAVIDKKRGFTHGIQVRYGQLKKMSKPEIKAKNQEKIQYLKEKTLRAIKEEQHELIFIRAQRRLTQEVIKNINLTFEALGSLRSGNPYQLYVVSPDRDYEKKKTTFAKKIQLIHFNNFSPANNPMLLQYSYPEWKRLFSNLGIPVQSISRKFTYFTGF